MGRSLLAAVLAAVLAPISFGQAWVSLGPAPITNGQTSTTPASVSGAVAHILIDPSSSSTYYAGTVNGGVWKSTNSGTSWTPLTDRIGSTSVGGLAFDPANSNTLVTGFGRHRSSYYLEGGRIGGFAYSLNGGTSWTTQYTLPTGTSVSGVAARSLGAGTGTVIVSANDRGTTYSRNGIFRSTNGGTSFTQISGAAGTGLPAMGVFGVAENATNSAQLYTVPDNTSGAYSVYRSNDTGSTWAAVGTATMNTQIASADTVKVSARGNVVVVGIVTGTTVNVWRSPDNGTNWTAWGSAPASNPGGQGLWHFNLLLDPTDATGNRVYLTGDATQTSPYNGRIYRGDFAAGTWTALFVNGSNAPHADGRSLAVNPTTGNLLQGNDGGIFSLPTPSGAFGSWASINGNLGTLEFHSAAFDPVSKVGFGGTQDNGTSRQPAVGNQGWTLVIGGDGAQVAVVTSPTNSAQSLRYMSSQYLGSFRKGTYNNTGGQVSLVAPSLTVAGSGGQTLFQYETANGNSVQFYGPIATNRADGQRLYIGTRRLYESTDQGNNLAVVRDFGAGVALNVIKADGFSGTTARPEVLYAGTNTGQVWVRKDTGGAMVQLTGYTAGGVADLAVQPTDWRHIVVGSGSQVVRSTNVDAATPTFTTITGNLFTANPGFDRLFSVETAHFGTKDVYVAGGRDGVYVTTSDALGTWTEFGTGLPDVVVTDIDYDSINDVLMVATLGRGVWTVPVFSTYFAPVPEPATVLLVAGVALGLGGYARRRWSRAG